MSFLNKYILERNQQLMELFPEHTDGINAQNERILTGKAKFEAMPLDKQLKALGIKSAPARQVLTPEQDKAKGAKRHEESNLQLKFSNWVKKWFPDDRFVTHKREGKRNGFNRATFNSFNNSDGHPDWEALIVCEGFTGLLIEFKKPGEDWLLKDGKTVKSSYRHQYACHLDLWKIGKAVYFCNDYDKAREIYKAFKSGNPLPQQLYVLK